MGVSGREILVLAELCLPFRYLIGIYWWFSENFCLAQMNEFTKQIIALSLRKRWIRACGLELVGQKQGKRLTQRELSSRLAILVSNDFSFEHLCSLLKQLF